MRRISPTTRTLVAGGAISAALLIGATPAGAHVTVSPNSAAAEGYTVLTLTVPHGCGGAATNEIIVQLPETFQSVTPQAVPGWEVTREMSKLDEPYELHGTTVDEYTKTIKWSTGTDPLPDDQYLTFGISAKMPAETADRVLLPVVQRCVNGAEQAWIDSDPASDLPAPAIAISTSAGGGHGETDEDASSAPTGDDNTTSSSSNNTLSIVALIAGLGGLGLGGFSLFGKKR